MNPLTLLRMYAELRAARPDLIRQARTEGHSWQAIADAAGMSRAMTIRLTETDGHQSSQ